MKIFSRKLFIAACIFSLLAGNAFALKGNDESAGVDRYAIYIGSNIGGKDNERLLYAGTDAMAFQNTMADIGGIRKSNSVLLLDPAKEDVDNAMEYISTLITRNMENSKRSEFVFYYSGHSDEKALLLGNNAYDYSTLKASISKVPSDVHVVILDSCYSGNFIRTKGGHKQKPFLVDDSSVIKGHAYLSSSSSQESSQESDEIGSSFFTNAMITGLRGAADSSGDKRVTLNELYSYAFSETLSKTENTSTGPQHPNYNITLVGSGDLVLSDISKSDCLLTIAKELSGRVIIRDRNEKLISEINKSPAGPVYLAMEAGQYGVTVISEKSTLQGSFELGANKNYVLSAGGLTPVARIANRLRGEGESSAGGEEAVEDADVTFHPFVFSFFANEFHRNEGKIKTNFALGLFRSDVYQTDGVMLSLLANHADIVRGAQVAYLFNTTKVLYGVQNAGIFNYAESVVGAQIAICFNIAKDVKYAQAASLVNVATEGITGGQGAGLVNYAKNVDGAQGAGIGNVCKGDVDGVQGAGIFNYASGKIDGVQGAGMFNYAYDMVDGGQLAGIFNYAGGNVDGGQFGLINICSGDVDGVQLGLVNYSKNGIFELGVSCTTDNDLRFTLSSGNRHFYSVIGCSLGFKYLNPDLDSSEKYASSIFGLGTRFEFGMCNLDLELLGNEVFLDEPDSDDDEKDVLREWYPSAKIAFGYSPVKRVQFFAGAMISCEYRKNKAAFEKKTTNIVIDTSHSDVKLHPEFELGVKIKMN